MNKLIVIATIALCMFLSTAISAQVITNHSFEDGTNPGSFATVNAGDVTIDEQKKKLTDKTF